MFQGLHVPVQGYADALDVGGHRMVFSQQDMEVDVVIGQGVPEVVKRGRDPDIRRRRKELGIGKGGCGCTTEDDVLGANQVTDLDGFAGGRLAKEERIDALGQILMVGRDPFQGDDLVGEAGRDKDGVVKSQFLGTTGHGILDHPVALALGAGRKVSVDRWEED